MTSKPLLLTQVSTRAVLARRADQPEASLELQRLIANVGGKGFHAATDPPARENISSPHRSAGSITFSGSASLIAPLEIANQEARQQAPAGHDNN